MILIGIDAGATATRALAVTRDGLLVGRGSGGPANPYVVGSTAAAGEISATAQRAASGRGTEQAVVVAGVAGIADPTLRHQLQAALPARGPQEQWHLLPDMAIALTGALQGQPGIVVIAGTGSVAIGRNERGEEARAGGWGHQVEDEGSGAAVGRGVLSAVLRGHDGRGPQTALTAPLLHALGVRQPTEISRAVQSMSVAELSALARLAVTAAGEGDAVATDLLNRAAAALAEMARAVWERLRFTGPHLVAWSGGLLKQTVVQTAFTAAMQRLRAEADVRAPLMPPAGGALVMAFTLAKLPLTDGLVRVLAAEEG